MSTTALLFFLVIWIGSLTLLPYLVFCVIFPFLGWLFGWALGLLLWPFEWLYNWIKGQF